VPSAHAPLQRGGVQDSPQWAEACHWRKRPGWGSWRMDESALRNAGNLLVFRVSGHDAKFLEDTFSPDVGRQFFVNLTRGEVIVRLVHDGTPSVPFVGTVTPAIENRHNEQGKIITWSRRRFTQPLHLVESQIAQVIAPSEPKETPTKHRRARR
jgi:hypothetical protein